MDIKPQNILVRILKTDSWGDWRPAHYAKVYISDFGIARSYQTLEAVNTDGATSFTRKYAAPEVVQQDSRGLPADIFSMGCVFTEIFTTLHRLCLSHKDHERCMSGELQKLLSRSADSSYQNHINSIRNLFESWSSQLDQNSTISPTLADLILRMLSRDPAERPTALEVTQLLSPLPCCGLRPDELEKYKDDVEDRTLFSNTEDNAKITQELVDYATIRDIIEGSCASCRTGGSVSCKDCWPGKG